MTHLDLLQASTDGLITPEEWRAARLADRQEAEAIDRCAGCRIKPDSIKLKPNSAVLRMARDLVSIRSAKGFAEETDLINRGWSTSQIYALRDGAIALAARLWTKRLEHPNRRIAA